MLLVNTDRVCGKRTRSSVSMTQICSLSRDTAALAPIMMGHCETLYLFYLGLNGTVIEKSREVTIFSLN